MKSDFNSFAKTTLDAALRTQEHMVICGLTAAAIKIPPFRGMVFGAAIGASTSAISYSIQQLFNHFQDEKNQFPQWPRLAVQGASEITVGYGACKAMGFKIRVPAVLLFSGVSFCWRWATTPKTLSRVSGENS